MLQIWDQCLDMENILFLKLIIAFQMVINNISKENQLRQFESFYSYITLNINQKGKQSF